MNNKTKKSQLVWDPKIVRKLLKLNTEIKFCPFCGTSIETGCNCHKNLIIDYKPYKNSDGVIEPNRSVAVFYNNAQLKEDNVHLIDEAKAKKEAEEPEQLSTEFD